MSIPRINPRLMSAATRANLERMQASLGFTRKTEDDQIETTKKPIISRKKKTLTPDMADTLVKSVSVSEDGNEVKLILGVNPDSIPTAQGKGAFVDKGGHVHFFTKPKQRKAEEAFQKALQPYAHLTRKWGNVPIELEIKLLFAYPSSTPKKHRHKIGPHTTKPDGDNCIKNEVDAMTRAGFWADDSFINTYHIYKRRTTGPACIVIKITNLQPKFEALFHQTDEHDKPTLFPSSQSIAKPSETNPLSDLICDEQSSNPQ